jgi:hypothetical protein
VIKSSNGFFKVLPILKKLATHWMSGLCREKGKVGHSGMITFLILAMWEIQNLVLGYCGLFDHHFRLHKTLNQNIFYAKSNGFWVP